ncbi:MAG: methionine gamma-lyase family protein [Firmicutes bacterium]|nr:methionine gamma-lyase family protein [Bacillota bacterium]
MKAKVWQKYECLFTEVEEQIASSLRRVARTVLVNQARVLAAFQELRVDETCFHDSTGYGYNDSGREKLDRLFACVFGAEAGLVRPQFVSGTHAIASCLYGILKPGSRLVSLTGRPYDTLQKALGLIGDGRHNLESLGISYGEADLCGTLEETTLDKALAAGAQVVYLQRSRGYAERRSLTVQQVGTLVRAVRQRLPETIIFVDNCYGEFVQEMEPCHVGVDLVAGSLIKNPGGGLATGGGYVVGRADLVEQAAWRLTAPGLGAGIGNMAGVKRLLYQGLFLSPHQTGETLKGMTLAAALFARLGLPVSPSWDEERGDTVQAIRLGDPELLQKFCCAVQASSPVDSYLTPLPAPMIGYRDEIIMAAGTFIQGASSEFSADAPLRPPYTVFLQGGLTYEHIKLALAQVLEATGLAR